MPPPTAPLRTVAALAAALVLLPACDAARGTDEPPDVPPQTFDDTPVPFELAIHDTPRLTFSLFNTGFQGSWRGNQSGQAFALDGVNGLYEGQLLIAASEAQVSGSPYPPAIEDWSWTEGSRLTELRDVGAFDGGYRTRFADAGPGDAEAIGVTVTQRAYVGAAAEGAAVLVYDVRNDGPDREGLYVGLFADFDVFVPAPNDAGFDAATQTVYTFDPSDGTPYHFGVRAVSHPLSGWSVDLPGGAATEDALLYAPLTTPGTISPLTDTTDRRTVIGAGPFALASGATQRVAFAYVAGASRAEMLAAADAAATAYDSVAGF